MRETNINLNCFLRLKFNTLFKVKAQCRAIHCANIRQENSTVYGLEVKIQYSKGHKGVSTVYCRNLRGSTVQYSTVKELTRKYSTP